MRAMCNFSYNYLYHDMIYIVQNYSHLILPFSLLQFFCLLFLGYFLVLRHVFSGYLLVVLYSSVPTRRLSKYSTRLMFEYFEKEVMNYRGTYYSQL